MNCNCIWQELPNQTGQVKGSVLVTECEPCRVKREDENTRQEKLKKYDSFSPKMFVEYTNAQLGIVERAKIAPYLAAMKDYMEYRFDDEFRTRNFRDMRLLCDQLATDGILSEATYNLIKSNLALQNINLDDF